MPSDAEEQVFVSFRFGDDKGEAEARATKQALEARGISVFLSQAVGGDNISKMICDGIVGCKLAIIFANRTYGARTNHMFDTGRERDYILSKNKPFYLIRMIPFDESWAESETEVAFPLSVMQKLWLPGTPMPADLIDEIVSKLRSVKGASFAARAAGTSSAALAVPSAVSPAQPAIAESLGATLSPDELAAECFRLMDFGSPEQAVLELLSMEQTVNVNWREHTHGTTLLCKAAEIGHKSVAEVLLTKGADVNKRNKYGFNAHHFAMKHKQHTMVEFLVKKGITKQSAAVASFGSIIVPRALW